MGKLELAFKTHPDFEAEAPTERREHAGAALAAWNQALGISPLFHFAGGGKIDEFVPAVKRWNTRNTALVAESRGYTELHAMLASVCPDEVLRFRQLARPCANFQLWPFTVESSRRATFADAAERAFADLIWRRLVGKPRTKRAHMDKGSSVRILIDDSRLWMKALYGVALERLDSRPKPPPPSTALDARFSAWLVAEAKRQRDVTSAQITGGKLVVTYTDGRTSAVPAAPLSLPEISFTLNPGDAGGQASAGASRRAPQPRHEVIWDPFDPRDREAVMDEMLAQPDVRDSILPVLDCLKRDVLPEDLPDRGYSRLKEDVERRLYNKRNKMKILFGHTVDQVAAYDADDPLAEGEAALRHVMALLDERQRKILILFRQGKSQNEIAADVGVKGHTRISRLLTQIEGVVYRHLDWRRPE